MRAMVFRHVSHEGLGMFRAVLAERGWEIDVREIRDLSDVPGSSLDGGTDLLIVMGGSMNVYAADHHPFLRREIEVLRRRLDEDRPTLGICLGAQLMAAALGAPVRRGELREVGWAPIEGEPAGRVDPHFSTLLDPPMTLHWHSDTFEIPAGCAILARSALYKSQAFRFGSRGYALQFHPEIPPEDLPVWIAQSDERLDEATTETMLAGARIFGDEYRKQGRRFLASWLAVLEGSD